MRCSEFSSRLLIAIETRDSTALAQLRSHAATCGTPQCQSLWGEQEVVTRGVAAWRAGRESPPRITPRVLDELHGSTAPRAVASAASQRRSLNPHWSVVALAAALLVAVGLSLRPVANSPSVAGRSPGQFIAPSGLAPQPAIAKHPATPEELPPRAGESYVELAHEATYFVTDLAMLVVPIDVDAPVDGYSPATWFDRLGDRIEPVKSGVEGKLGEWFGPPAT